MKQGTMKLLFPLLFVCIFVISLFISGTNQVVASNSDDGEAGEVSQDISSVADIKSLVEQLADEGEFGNDQAAHALTLHLTAVHHYEKQDKKDKVIKHMEGFLLLLDHQKENGQLSEHAYNSLKADAEALLEKWNSLTIVRDGQANAVVLVAGDADDENSDAAIVTNQAAGVLVEYVQKSTGVQLPIMTVENFEGKADNFEDHIRIYIGDRDLNGDGDIEEGLENLDEQGFLIHSHENSVTIVGPSAWGTMHGVYDFLERYVDVRWLMPGPAGEDVPQANDLKVSREDVREEPVSKHRFISSGLDQDWLQWLQRNKLQRGDSRGVYEDGQQSLNKGDIRPIKFMHNLHALLPQEKYGETHPEFYPDGNPPAPGVTTGWQPCFTEEETVDAAASEIIAYFEEHSEETSYSLGVNDSRGYCEANPSHPEYPGKMNSIGAVDMSDIYYEWINAVVKQVLEEYPDKKFGLLAYGNVMDPPSFPLNPRVVPFLTKDRMAWADEEIRAEGHQQMDEWNEVANQVAWYDYLYGVSYNVPRVYPHLMAENYQYAAQNHVYGHNAEMYHNAGDGPKAWLSAKLQWDPYQDIDVLLQEWYERTVGPEAASDLAAYFDLWEQFWTERIHESPWFQSGKGSTYLEFVNPSYLDLVTVEDIMESKQLLESVVAKAGTDQQKARAEILQRSFAYYEASGLSYPQKVEPPKDEEEALTLLDEIADTIDQRIQLAQKRFELVEEFESDPALRFPSSPRGHWSGWNSYEFWHLADYMVSNEPEGGAVTDKVHELSGSEPSKQRDFTQLLEGVNAGTLDSLTENSSFEVGDTNAAEWTFWNPDQTANIQRVEGTANEGNASVLFEEAERGGVYQIFEVQPGLTAAQVQFYTPPGADVEGGVRLVLTMRNDDGKTLGDYISSLIPVSETAGEWSTIEMLEEIPSEIDDEQVSEILVNAQVHDAPDSQVYLDDVVVYQLEEPNDDSNGDVTILTKNSSFEEGNGTAPPWGFWIPATSSGTIARVEGVAHTGNASLLVDSMERGGPLQIFPIEPGLTGARVHFYTPSDTEDGSIQLGLHARNAQGENLTSFHTSRTELALSAGEWSSLELLEEIPDIVDNEKVKEAYVIVTIDGAEDAQVYVDDFVVYQENEK